MGAIKHFMAVRCENCPLCKRARENPDTLFGKVMAFHGKFCPFWRSYEAEQREKQVHQAQQQQQG
jgi:hypothetical protein